MSSLTRTVSSLYGRNCLNRRANQRPVRLVVNDRKFSAKTVYFSHTKPASSNNPRSYTIVSALAEQASKGWMVFFTSTWKVICHALCTRVRVNGILGSLLLVTLNMWLLSLWSLYGHPQHFGLTDSMACSVPELTTWLQQRKLKTALLLQHLERANTRRTGSIRTENSGWAIGSVSNCSTTSKPPFQVLNNIGKMAYCLNILRLARLIMWSMSRSWIKLLCWLILCIGPCLHSWGREVLKKKSMCLFQWRFCSNYGGFYRHIGSSPMVWSKMRPWQPGRTIASPKAWLFFNESHHGNFIDSK